MTRRILLIDDDELLSDLLSSLLVMEGYDVATAPDGEAGLLALDQGSFDLIVLDLLMPRMDGLRFLKELAARDGAQPPVLVLSASAAGGAAEAARASGVVDVMRKPVEPGVLLAAIARVLDQR
jgi:DNA-binding response OmpR family regulator